MRCFKQTKRIAVLLALGMFYNALSIPANVFASEQSAISKAIQEYEERYNYSDPEVNEKVEVIELPKEYGIGSAKNTTVPAYDDPLESGLREANYLNEDEKEMIREINLVRTHPEAYIKFVQNFQTYLNVNEKAKMAADIDELIDELVNMTPVDMLKPKECVYEAAKQHAETSRPTGQLTHFNPDGTMPWDRVKAACSDVKEGNENLVGGPESIRKAVIYLLIDHGIATRGHRRTMLHPKWNYVACYQAGTVGAMPNNWVQKYGAGPRESQSLASNNTSPAKPTAAAEKTEELAPKPEAAPVAEKSPTEAEEPATIKVASPNADASVEEELSNANYLNEREKEMIREVNMARTNPVGYVKYIEEHLAKVQENPSGIFAGSEGTIRELIDELNTMSPVSALKPKDCLYTTAKNHAESCRPTGSIEHRNPDGTMPWDRVKAGCSDLKDGNENLVGGPESIRKAVILLLVDHGIATRGHRRTMLDAKWEYLACYEAGTVGSMPHNWVQKYGCHAPLGASNAAEDASPTSFEAPKVNSTSFNPPAPQNTAMVPEVVETAKPEAAVSKLNETGDDTPKGLLSNKTPEVNSTVEAPKKTNEVTNEQNTAIPGYSDPVEAALREASYLNEDEMEMIREINLVRTHPEAYIKYVQNFRTYLKPDEKAKMSADIDELIAELESMRPVRMLKPKECVYEAAKGHAESSRPTGKITHLNPDGTMPWDRVQAACPDIKEGNENLVGGPESIRKAIIYLLIDNGVPSRGHRVTMLNPKWNYVSCYQAGTIGSMPHNWVQKYAAGGAEAYAEDAGSVKAPKDIASSIDAASYLTDREKEMIREINLVRSDPTGYIKHIEAYMKPSETGDFSADAAAMPACQELIQELRSMKPASVLRPKQCVFDAAKKHAEECRPMGDIDHQNPDGSWPWDRVRNACDDLQDGEENIVGGPSIIRTSVIMLLVDDGIPNRGHRRTMLNPKWEYVACYEAGKVGIMPHSWVQLFGTSK